MNCTFGEMILENALLRAIRTSDRFVALVAPGMRNRVHDFVEAATDDDYDYSVHETSLLGDGMFLVYTGEPRKDAYTRLTARPSVTYPAFPSYTSYPFYTGSSSFKIENDVDWSSATDTTLTVKAWWNEP